MHASTGKGTVRDHNSHGLGGGGTKYLSKIGVAIVCHRRQEIFLSISRQPIQNMGPLIIPMGASLYGGPDQAERGGGGHGLVVQRGPQEEKIASNVRSSR